MKTNLDLRFELESIFNIKMERCDWCEDCWTYHFKNASASVLIFDQSYRVSYGGFLITDDINKVLEIFRRISDNPEDYTPVF